MGADGYIGGDEEDAGHGEQGENPPLMSLRALITAETGSAPGKRHGQGDGAAAPTSQILPGFLRLSMSACVLCQPRWSHVDWKPLLLTSLMLRITPLSRNDRIPFFPRPPCNVSTGISVLDVHTGMQARASGGFSRWELAFLVSRLFADAQGEVIDRPWPQRKIGACMPCSYFRATALVGGLW